MACVRGKRVNRRSLRLWKSPAVGSGNSTDLDRASDSRQVGAVGSEAGIRGRARPVRQQPRGASDCRMNKTAADPAQPYRSLIAGYTDAIRAERFQSQYRNPVRRLHDGPGSRQLSRDFRTICQFPLSCCRLWSCTFVCWQCSSLAIRSAAASISWCRAKRPSMILPTSSRRKTNSSS